MAKRRILAILMTLMMLFQALPVSALADAAEDAWNVADAVSEGASYCDVTFLDENGNTLARQLVQSGQGLVLPEDRAKASDESGSYRFKGWAVQGSVDLISEGYVPSGSSVTIVPVFELVDTVTLRIVYDYEGNREILTPVEYQYDAGDETSYSFEAPKNVLYELEGGESVFLYPKKDSFSYTPKGLTDGSSDLGGTYEDGVYTLVIEYELSNAEYTVRHLAEPVTEGVADHSAYTLIKEEKAHGYTGTKADVIKLDTSDPEYSMYEYEGYDELILTGGNDDVLNVYYKRKQFTLNYDRSAGGSYIEPKHAKYGAEVDVYTHSAGSRTLICGKEAHTHNLYCGFGFLCDKDEHTHNASCYTTTSGAYNPTPTREGYTFAGWYLDPGCTQPALEKMELTEDTTVYPKWEASDANYTMVYMREVYQDGVPMQSFVTSRTASARVGSTVSASDIGMPTDSSYNTQYNTQYYNATSTAQESATVKADGSTVVYGLFTLKEYTYTFNINNDSATLHKGGGTYTKSQYTLKVKLGMDISSQWPAKADFTPENQANRFNGWDPSHTNTNYVTKRYIVTEEMLPSSGTNVTFTGQWSGRVSGHSVEYWLQNIDDDNYTKSTKHSESYNSNQNSLSAKEIAGFKYDHESSGNGTSRFYYTRNSYTLSFKYSGANGVKDLKDGELIRFGKSIVDRNYTPTAAAAGVDANYVFEGWYDNPECMGEKYDFDTMPSKDLQLYAKFVPPTRTVTIHYHDGVSERTATVELVYGQSVKQAGQEDRFDGTRPGYTFTGWYTASEGGSEFDVNMPVTENIHVYARWERLPLTYTVRYLDESGKPLAPDAHRELSLEIQEGAPEATVREDALSIHGYRVDVYTRECALKQAGNNEIVFKYTKRAGSAYTVNYVDADTGDSVQDSKDAEVSEETERVTEIAPKIDGYYLVGKSIQTIPIASDATRNVITFEYRPYQYVAVQVKHVVLNAEGNAVYSETDDPVDKLIGDSVTVEPKTFGDATFDHYERGVSYYVAIASDVPNHAPDKNAPIELIAYYKLGEWQVHYAFEGEVPEGAKKPDDATLKCPFLNYGDSSYTLVDPEPVDGYQFDGWYLNGQKVTEIEHNFLGQHDFTVTGKWVPLDGSLTIYKTVVGPALTEDTSFTFEITDAKGNAHSATVTVAANGTTGSAKADGIPVGEATVKETGHEGYTVDAESKSVTIPAGDNVDVRFTNTIAQDYIEIAVEKTWVAPADQIPEDITVTLTANGSPTDKTLTLSAANGWSGTFANLEKYDLTTGQEIQYNVTEQAIAGFATDIQPTTDNAPSYAITNTKENDPGEQPEKSVTSVGGVSFDGQPVKVGDTITYSIGYYNNTNQTQTITLTDNLPAGVEFQSAEPAASASGSTVTWTISDVAPFAKGSVTLTVAVTEAALGTDAVTNPELRNTATLEIGDQPSQTSDPATVTVEKEAWTVEKTVSGASGENGAAKVGDTLSYTVTVKNTGNVDLSGLQLEDTFTINGSESNAKLSWTDGDPTQAFDLAEGATKTFTATYTVLATDANLSNTAKVGDESTTIPTPVESNPSLSITKEITSTPQNGKGYDLNEPITYRITVKNTGNVMLENVYVVDNLTGDVWSQGVEGGENNGQLLPGQEKSFDTSYTVQEDDILAGKVTNVATAQGHQPGNDTPLEVTATATATAADPRPELNVTKTATSEPANGEYYVLGEAVEYTITVENTGNVTVYNIDVIDEQANTDAEGGVVHYIADLAPGASVPTEHVTHTITEDDILNGDGEFLNTAMAKGTGPKNAEVTASDDETVPIEELNAALTVTKTADKTSDAALNDVINYTITVTNSGNVTVSDITVEDSKTELNENIGSLAPGESTSVTTTHTITEDDILAGSFVNTATAKGTGPKNAEVTASDDETVTTVEAAPALTVTKTATQKEGGFAVNDSVTFLVTVTNDGNVTLSNVTITDDALTGALIPNPVDGVELAPGESSQMTVLYTVTDADVANGSITNTAEATASDPNGNELAGDATATVTTVTMNADITITKAAIGTATDYEEGATIDFVIDVENNGNVALHDVTVSEQEGVTFAEGAGYSLSEGKAIIESLPLNGSVRLHATNTVTQADIDAGEYANTTSVTAKAPDDTEVTGAASATVRIDQNPGLTAEKTLTNSGSGDNGEFKAGETATFDIVVTNTGNTTQESVTVSEMDGATILAGDGYSVEGNVATIDELAPGDSVTVKASYAITQEMIDAGAAISNVATVSGTGTTTGPDPEPVPIEPQNPGLTAEKTLTNSGSGDNGEFKAGETATFDIVVTNTGNTTQGSVTVSEMDGATILAGDGYSVEGNVATIDELAPGGSVTVKASYAITQEMIDAGAAISNVATVSGGDGTTTGPDPEPVPIEPQNPGSSVDKTVTGITGAEGAKATAGPASLGDVITYQLVVTNTGNVTLKGETVTDSLAGIDVGSLPAGVTYAEGAFTIDELAPNDSVTITYSYTVTEADIKAGSVANTATTPNGGTGTTTTDTDPENPSSSVVKTATIEGGKARAAAGDVITYQLLVTNTGNVTLKGETVTDSLAGIDVGSLPAGVTYDGGTFTIESLAPGASVTITYTYTVSDADVANGCVKNAATTISGGEDEHTTILSTEITVTKVWNDDGYLNVDHPGATLVLTGSDGSSRSHRFGRSGGSYTFTDLPMATEDGTPITYTVDEPTVPDDFTKAVDSDTYTVTNTYAPEPGFSQGSLTIKKVWEGVDGDEIPVDEVQVEVIDRTLIGSGAIWRGTLTAAENWTKTITVTKVGYFSARELDFNVPGYTSAQGSVYFGILESANTAEVSVTNTYTGDLAPVTVTKTWNDPRGGANPTVQLQLLQNGEVYDTATLGGSRTPTNSRTFNVPRYDKAGNAYTYTVQEVGEEGNQLTIGTATYNVSYNGLNVTNALAQATADIPVSKTWTGVNEGDPLPASVTVNLQANGSTVASLELNADNDWSGTFEDVELLDGSGKLITYSLVEANKPNGYTASVTGSADTGFAVTNAYTGMDENDQLTSVDVEKVWTNTNGATNMPAVTLVLTGSNGAEYEVTLNGASDNWKHTFDNLPVYDTKGERISYTVDEASVPSGYSKTVNGTTVTNAYTGMDENDQLTSITANKVWTGVPEGSLLPASVTLVLTGSDGSRRTQEAEAPDWRCDFASLPVFGTDGQPITYTVDEASVTDGYEKTGTGSVDNNYTVTNAYTGDGDSGERATVTVTKVWTGIASGDPLPGSVTLQVRNGSQVVGSADVTAAKNWTYTLGDLPVYDTEGNAIDYTVGEANVPLGYTQGAPAQAADGSWTIPNEYTGIDIDGSVSITAQKLWTGINGATNMPEVTLQLKIGDAVVDAATVSATDNWQHTFTDLKKYDTQGNPIVYTVDEASVPDGYEKTETGSAGNGYTVTNNYTGGDTVSVQATKAWMDANGGAIMDKLPASVTLLLRNGNEEVDRATVTAADGWTHEFTGLKKFGTDGIEIVYTVDEESVPNGYEKTGIGSAGNGYTVTNTYTGNGDDGSPIDVTVNKTWSVPDGSPLPASVTLVLNGSDGSSHTQEVMAPEWSCTFTDLPVYDTNGEEITYTADEAGVPNGYSMTADGTTVTNTYTGADENNEMLTVTATKAWVDANGDAISDNLPASVELVLYRNGEEIARDTVTARGGWSCDFTDLPVYDTQSNPYTYTVDEASVTDGYEKTGTGSADNNYTVTNAYNGGPAIEIQVSKIWIDDNNGDNTRPDSITVTLMRDYDATETTLSLTAENQWSGAFTDLPTYDTDGQRFLYNVREESVENYTTEPIIPTVDNAAEYTIINRIAQVNDIEVSGAKTWIDGENQNDTRPDSITINLLRDNIAIDSRIVTANDNWSWSWTELPRYDVDGNGHKYIYSVTEDSVDGYTSAQTENGFTNTISDIDDEVTVSGAKTWVDGNDERGTRPDSITINLLRDDAVIDSKTVTANDNWSWSWTVRKYEQATGHQYTYSVSEDQVSGYTSVQSENDFTNTIADIDATDVTVTGTKVWVDGNNEGGNRPANSSLNLTLTRTSNNPQGVAETVDVAPAWNGNTYTYSNLARYDADGYAYSYSVTEAQVDGYDAPAYGTDANGQTITNTITDPSDVTVTGTKIWVDGGRTHDNAAEIALTLTRSAEGTSEPVQAAPVWDGNTYTYSGLERYNVNGYAYSYSVTEAQVAGYDAPVYGTDASGQTITNTITDAASVTVTGTKTWVDGGRAHNNAAQVRLTLTRISDNPQGARETVAATPTWSGNRYTFSGLDQYDEAGYAYTYSVTENEMANYTATYDGNNIVNTRDTVTLTVRYWYGGVGGAVAAPTFTRTYYVGDAFNVASPFIAGYDRSRARVSGTMPGRDLVYDVIYTPITYTLTINYVYADGTTAAATYTATLALGDGFAVPSPVIDGFTASTVTVAGTMPGRNLVYTVIYVGGETEILTDILIDEYGVPLNIGNVTMNVGDCFE